MFWSQLAERICDLRSTQGGQNNVNTGLDAVGKYDNINNGSIIRAVDEWRLLKQHINILLSKYFKMKEIKN